MRCGLLASNRSPQYRMIVVNYFLGQLVTVACRKDHGTRRGSVPGWMKIRKKYRGGAAIRPNVEKKQVCAPTASFTRSAHASRMAASSEEQLEKLRRLTLEGERRTSSQLVPTR